MKRIFAICWVTLLFGTLVTETNAQRRVPMYLNRPRVSPYVSLYGNNIGGANTYLGLVRPLEDQRRLNAYYSSRDLTFQQQLAQDRSAFPHQLADQLGRVIEMRSSRGHGQPSSAASFMNYSHFYGQPSGGAPANAAAAR